MIIGSKDFQEYKTHPRHGYVVAVYVGVRGRLDEVQILVEVYETYNVWGEEDSKGHHYQPYDLTTGLSMEVKTIGRIDAPEPGHLPPRFVQNVFKDYHWKRLR